jgi:uncharacterized membrane protein YkvI
MKSNTMGILAVAFVWFTTHFGGGFASGRQLVDFFVAYGWYALFTPILSLAIVTAMLYYAWSFAVTYNTFDYRAWGNKYFQPFEAVFSNAYEVMYILILLIASAVAFATGGTVMNQILGTPYITNTVIVAVFIFFLTIFGADMVRKAASTMAVIIIAGMTIIYVGNLITNFPKLFEIIRTAPSPHGFTDALWASLKYAGFQACAMGAYIAVADALKTREDARKASVWGFIINAGILWLATAGVLLHFPSILQEKVPVLYVAAHGGGGTFGTAIVSLLIFLAVISTGVSLIFGGARRIVALWGRTRGASVAGDRKVNIVASLIYVLITWGIALFGLIPLVAKGYGYMGTLSLPLLILPVIIIGLFRSKDWGKDESSEGTPED